MTSGAAVGFAALSGDGMRTCSMVYARPFNADAMVKRLLQGHACETNFRLMECSLSASSMTSMTVECDGEHVYVGVLLLETLGFGFAAKASTQTQGAGQNVVEVLWLPWNDGTGFLQFGAGPASEVWFNSHWPYRDGRRDLSARPRFEADWHVQAYGEDVARVVIFKFARTDIFSPEAKAVGFNVMRSELRNEENSAWVSKSSFFGDPACTGLLLTDQNQVDQGPFVQDPPVHAEHQPQAASTSAPTASKCHQLPASKPRPTPQLAVTYDFPDESLNAPYTPELLRKELLVLRDAGVSRIDWIDYPFWCSSFARLAQEPAESSASLPYTQNKIDFARQTCQAFEGQILRHAAVLTRELGMAFHTVIKPFDLWPKWTMPHTSASAAANRSRNGRHVSWGDPFLEAHGNQYAFARNGAWETKAAGPITQLTFWSDNTLPTAFDASQIRLWFSDDNVQYQQLPSCNIQQGVAMRQRMTCSPAGDQIIDGEHEDVRFIRLNGFEIKARYLAVEVVESAVDTFSQPLCRCDYPQGFGNQRFSLIEARARDGSSISITIGWPAGKKRSRFEFNYSSNKAEWACVSEAMQRRLTVEPGVMIPLATGHDPHMAGMLEPSFTQVQDYWLEHYIQRAIDVGANGVDVRVAHHQGCSSWLDYGWAEPVLTAFRERIGRDPKPVNEDYQTMRRIRGQAYTNWLRRSKTMLAAANMTLEHHLESRMVTPVAHDTYLQIHWDWQRWLDEGLVDGLNLKYLGAANSFVHQQLLPRAKRNGASIRVIDAPLDPRNHPRAVESHGYYLQMIADAGLDGLSLYEAWTYLRTTPDGDLVRRGNAGPIFEQFASMLK